MISSALEDERSPSCSCLDVFVSYGGRHVCLVQVFAGFLMGQLPYVLDGRLICLIASAISAACWSWEGIILAKGCGGRDDAGPSGVSRVFDARRMRMVPALFFCIGCLRPLAMMWCFPHFACGALWGTQVVGNPMASLGLVASVIGVGMWVVRIARPGVGSPTGVSRRYACALLGSYASAKSPPMRLRVRFL